MKFIENRKLSVTVFFIIQILLLVLTVSIFIIPLMNQKIEPEKYYDEKTKTYADNIIQVIHENKLTSLNKEFVERNENIENGLKILNDYFASNKIESIKLVDCSYNVFKWSRSGETKTTLFTYNIKFEKGFVILQIETYEKDNTLKINTIKITPTEKSVEETNNFYEHDIFGTRIFLLLLVILLIGFIMYSEYDYLKKAVKPKIWLQIAMVISIISIDINWTSLVLNIELLQISLMPVSIFRFGIAADWHLIYYLPVMAILYWAVFRKKAILHGKSDDAQNVVGQQD